MEGGGRAGRGSASAEGFHSPGEDGLEVTGYPFAPLILPPLHLALRAPLLLCSANQAHSFLREEEEERECACESECMCIGVLRQTGHRETHV